MNQVEIHSRWCIWVPFSIIFMFHTSVYADQAGLENHYGPDADAHSVQVERMLELMLVPDQVDKAANHVFKIYSAEVISNDVDENVRLIVDAYQKDLEALVYSVLGWERQKSIYVENYSARMNSQDVAAVIQFLESAPGKNLMVSQVSANEQIQQVVKHLVETNMSKPLVDLAKQFREIMADINVTKEETTPGG